MSKMDAMRAMREARYEQRSTTAPTGRTTAPKPVRLPVSKTVEVSEPPAAAGSEQLCGHRSMNGRTCTREHGHAVKSHRYS